tara:strand:+ start:4968 stop:5780 length:813 start_codon:yes stop_codon:yes gene_type:complete
MLTIYAPLKNKKSKAWEVFNGVKKSWPEQVVVNDNGIATEPLSNSMFWGFVNRNLELIKKLETRKQQYWFTDTPYFGRFDNNNLKQDNHYWRICKNAIHAKYIPGCKKDRFEKFGIELKAPDLKGEHILVCPSSPGINQYLERPNWTAETVEQIKRYTDRPIKIREKPRGKGTSGPAVATIPIEKDLENAWCIVTSCSISAIEAVCNGKPVFCDEKSFAQHIATTNLADIENPMFVSPEDWLYSLSYQQFTPEEFSNGTAIEILLDKGLL